MSQMTSYLDLIKQIAGIGVRKSDRTGTGTHSIFGPQLTFDLKQGFPLLQEKTVPFHLVMKELLWMLDGQTNANILRAQDCHIWDEWADEHGNLGPIYGKQWRDVCTADGTRIDQIREIHRLLDEDPDSRRMIVNAWNVAELGEMALTPCHAMFQFWTRELTWDQRIDAASCTARERQALLDMDRDDKLFAELERLGAPKRALSCKLYQRSADMFLGVPFNIASYAALTHMFAHIHNMVADYFIWSAGDAHVYSNHLNQVQELCNRGRSKSVPQLHVRSNATKVWDIKLSELQLVNYKPQGVIKAPVAV